jgi:hypothetical protein
MASEHPPSNPLQRATAPIARAGVKGAQGLARRLGLDRAAERGVERALDSETAANATEKLLKSDTANRVWDKVLESDEAQKLVERVAEAPEVRAAITSQGIGLVEDLRRGVRRACRQVDTVLENGARRFFRKPRRERRPIFAGAFSRMLALAIDAGTVVLALGFSAWSLIAVSYLVVFWSGAGRTLGMSFVAIRMLSEDGERVRPGQAFHRAVWLPIAALPFFLGFRGVLVEGERRGWPDRRAHTVVCYADPDLDQDLANASPPR